MSEDKQLGKYFGFALDSIFSHVVQIHNKALKSSLGADKQCLGQVLGLASAVTSYAWQAGTPLEADSLLPSLSTILEDAKNSATISSWLKDTVKAESGQYLFSVPLTLSPKARLNLQALCQEQNLQIVNCLPATLATVYGFWLNTQNRSEYLEQPILVLAQNAEALEMSLCQVKTATIEQLASLSLPELGKKAIAALITEKILTDKPELASDISQIFLNCLLAQNSQKDSLQFSLTKGEIELKQDELQAILAKAYEKLVDSLATLIKRANCQYLGQISLLIAENSCLPNLTAILQNESNLNLVAIADSEAYLLGLAKLAEDLAKSERSPLFLGQDLLLATTNAFNLPVLRAKTALPHLADAYTENLNLYSQQPKDKTLAIIFQNSQNEILAKSSFEIDADAKPYQERLTLTANLDALGVVSIKLESCGPKATEAMNCQVLAPLELGLNLAQDLQVEAEEFIPETFGASGSQYLALDLVLGKVAIADSDSVQFQENKDFVSLWQKPSKEIATKLQAFYAENSNLNGEVMLALPLGLPSSARKQLNDSFEAVGLICNFIPASLAALNSLVEGKAEEFENQTILVLELYQGLVASSLCQISSGFIRQIANQVFVMPKRDNLFNLLAEFVKEVAKIENLENISCLVIGQSDLDLTKDLTQDLAKHSVKFLDLKDASSLVVEGAVLAARSMAEDLESGGKLALTYPLNLLSANYKYRTLMPISRSAGIVKTECYCVDMRDANAKFLFKVGRESLALTLPLDTQMRLFQEKVNLMLKVNQDAGIEFVLQSETGKVKYYLDNVELTLALPKASLKEIKPLDLDFSKSSEANLASHDLAEDSLLAVRSNILRKAGDTRIYQDAAIPCIPGDLLYLLEPEMFDVRRITPDIQFPSASHAQIEEWLYYRPCSRCGKVVCECHLKVAKEVENTEEAEVETEAEVS